MVKDNNINKYKIVALAEGFAVVSYCDYEKSLVYSNFTTQAEAKKYIKHMLFNIYPLARGLSNANI